MRDVSKKLFWQFIVLLIIIRVFMVTFLIFGIPSLEGLRFDGFVPMTRTGDERLYHQQATKVLNLDFSDEYGLRGVGTALYYSVFLLVTNTPAHPNGSYWLIFPVQSILMYSVSIIAVIQIARYILNSKKQAIIVGFLYIFYPYLIYVLNIGPYEHNYSNFLDAMWFKSFLSDAPSAFFTYLGIMFFVLTVFAKDKIKYSIVYSGVLSGIATLIRITNVLACVAMGAILFFKKKYKELLLLFVFSFGVFSLQLIHNKYNQGGFFKFGRFSEKTIEMQKERYPEVHLPGRIAQRGVTPANYFYLLSIADKYIPYFSFLLFVFISVSVISFYYLFNINRTGALFVFLWIVLYGLLYGAFDAAARNIRYWLPIIPAVLIMVVVFFDMLVRGGILLINKFKKYEQA